MCGLLRAAQSGDFTYEDYGSYVAITDYPTTGSGSLTIPGAIDGKPVRKIARRAFYQCSLLTAVTLPPSITHIEDEAFSFCGALAAINFPSGLTFIGSNAFQYCDGLTTVSLPSSLTTLGGTVFTRCAKLASISISALNPAYTSEGGVLFNKTKTILLQFPAARSGAYTVPATVAEIGAEAFFGAVNLTGIEFPSGLVRISDLAFEGCRSLSQISLPSTLKILGASAFSHSGITEASLPSSLTLIGNSAFYACGSLTQARISENVKSLGFSVFGDCQLLDSISVSPANPYFSEKDGVVFNASGTTLLLFPSGRAGHYDVPFGVTSIGDSAFTGSRKLESVSLPAGLNSIASGAFMICSGMKTVQLPVGLTSIGASAFWGCSALTGITIPASVTSIQFYAFYGCRKLAHATFRGDAPVMGSVVFTSTPAAFEIRRYQNATGFDTPAWQGFKMVDLGILTVAPEAIIVHSPDGTGYANGVDAENFGIALAGKPVTRIFTVRNAGEVSLAGLSGAIDGPDAVDFIVAPPVANTVAPGGFTTISVTFQPQAAGEKQAVLRIFSSDSSNSPFEIGLTGQMKATAPEIIVMQPVGSSLVDGYAKRSFGTVKTGSNGISRTFMIKNTGTARLSGLSILKSGLHKADFQVAALPRNDLEPGALMTFKVTFRAKAKGTRSAAIHIRSNDANENPFDIKLTGMGVYR